MGRRANGEGNFNDLGNGKVRYRKMIGYKPNGKPKIVTVTCSSKSECLRVMKEREAENNKKTNSDKLLAKSTLTELCQKHLEEQMSQPDRLKDSSVDRRECTINNQIRDYNIGSMQVTSITYRDIKEHIEGLIGEGLSVSSVKKCLDVINAAYKWAVDNNILINNPCTPILNEYSNRFTKLEKKEAIEADVIILDDTEIETFFDVAYRTYKDGTSKYPVCYMAKLQYLTGPRISEVCALRWKDYDKEQCTLNIQRNLTKVKNRTKVEKTSNYITKEGKLKNLQARVIEINEETVDLLEEVRKHSRYTGPNDYIFLNKNGKPYVAASVYKLYNTIFKKAGINASGTHIFRRTFATKQYDLGMSTTDIAAYMGDLEETIKKHYIAVRKRIIKGDKTYNVVPLPSHKR